ncbi:retron St85 family RNA-directed DNA polymerase [Photobacterium leiognathi]|uniref:retron St85 family RNA-directed DNA polymerase n=1 Tax=Photobacterium leiognathi TaxID=553611 RepID=UPI002981D132|nr:retron St85 family RNA-directed DNA polymerase [Photobacterium leiognathi]
MIDLHEELLNNHNIYSYSKEKIEDNLAGYLDLFDYNFDELIHKCINHTLEEIKNFGPTMYKVYTIPKRNGGNRTIAHPAKKLKLYQRELIKILDNILPIHPCSFAYKKNTSIKDNAEMHIKNSYLLKMDLSDFFNSITFDIVKENLTRHNIFLTKESYNLLKCIAFWCPSKSRDGKFILSVGAPSSPSLSNFIMYNFDETVNVICKSYNVTYTRYADDLFFSTNEKNTLEKLPNIINFILDTLFKSEININHSKTKFSSKAHNRHITGITLANNCKASIGRERKRNISSQVHKYKLGLLDNTQTKKLQGLIGFAKNIEPEFYQKLEKKYSIDIINKIKKGKLNE